MNESIQWFLQNVVGWIGAILIASLFFMALLMVIGFFVNLVCDLVSQKTKTFSDEVIRIAKLERELCPACGCKPRLTLRCNKRPGREWKVCHCVACSKCGRYVVSAGPDEAVKLWNKAAKKRKRPEYQPCEAVGFEGEDFALEEDNA